MIFFWWLLGALLLIAVIAAAGLSAGILVQVSADLAQGCAAVSVNVLNVQVLRIKLFECGGAFYYTVNGGVLHTVKAARPKREKGHTRRADGKQRKQVKIRLKSVSVNAAVGTENAAATAVMSAALESVIPYFLQKYIKSKDCKSAVNAEYGESNVKINACAVAGWGALLTAGIAMKQIKRG